MPQPSVLWVDDEMESLESHRRFLEAKGYRVHALSNGHDALEYLHSHPVDVVLLDETMPGLSGLETLTRIRQRTRNVPVVMVTRNETEDLMDEAIGSQISDYLIKPVNPHQVLSCLKKIFDNRRLVAEKTASDYQRQLAGMYGAWDGLSDPERWAETHRGLIDWELEMERSDLPEMREVHRSQMQEADAEFFRYVSRQYAVWTDPKRQAEAPLMSHNLFQRKVLPHAGQGQPLVWIVIDNLRYDQWKAIEPVLADSFRIQEESAFLSILPTATHYSRNALFSGLLPSEMQRIHPDLWLNEEDEGGKNAHEEDFLKAQLRRLRREDLRSSYQKVITHQDAQRLADQAHNLLNFDLSVVVYNFVDQLSHARTEVELLKELAADEAGYRSLTLSWFLHSPLHQALRRIAEKRMTLILSTDHGSVRVRNACKVVGDRHSSTNLRYKQGRNLDYAASDVLAFRDPLKAGLPSTSVNASFIFAKPDAFLCYPNHYNQFANLYRNTFQHGGVSMAEMIVPVVRMTGR
jgi:CheY-like chemotaxis protein